MIEVKIRDHCDIRKSTQIRPTEQIYVFILHIRIKVSKLIK